MKFWNRKNIDIELNEKLIAHPKTGICKCKHKWSWHYIASNNNTCYANKINGGTKCNCNGYEE